MSYRLNSLSIITTLRSWFAMFVIQEFINCRPRQTSQMSQTPVTSQGRTLRLQGRGHA